MKPSYSDIPFVLGCWVSVGTGSGQVYQDIKPHAFAVCWWSRDLPCQMLFRWICHSDEAANWVTGAGKLMKMQGQMYSPSACYMKVKFWMAFDDAASLNEIIRI